jgi:hypothetical protein
MNSFHGPLKRHQAHTLTNCNAGSAYTIAASARLAHVDVQFESNRHRSLRPTLKLYLMRVYM